MEIALCFKHPSDINISGMVCWIPEECVVAVVDVFGGLIVAFDGFS